MVESIVIATQVKRQEELRLLLEREILHNLGDLVDSRVLD